ncbi:bacteriohemerythrin [Marinospirillum alkaliphilum]|uniref:Hemerythrin-like metal-binding domain protein n=1 Tax=Marinospirillum alkaliphilum DSM 21637 TaxID=1122209 RepID=A0A1K1XGA5_9GAMM|nr:hemerythrin family protein [Marinospirillum alkaliphilum]SFX48738.1 hemerythrin-like metal-binding domain protein [Marinospirillum alkaliphilum DSM 21637]
MDQDHLALHQLLDALQQADKAAFKSGFAELIELTARHFAEEELLMDQSGFPATAEHKSEHARLLSEMRQIGQRVAEGKQMLGRGYVQDRLPQWLKLHVSSVDSSLVAHLQKSGLGDAGGSS